MNLFIYQITLCLLSIAMANIEWKLMRVKFFVEKF